MIGTPKKKTQKMLSSMVIFQGMAIRIVEFSNGQAGSIKLEIFLTKNQRTKRKLLNSEFWINGELSKSDKI